MLYFKTSSLNISFKRILDGFHSQTCLDPFKKLTVFSWGSCCSVLPFVQYHKDTKRPHNGNKGSRATDIVKKRQLDARSAAQWVD